MSVAYITVARVKEAMRSSYNGSDDAVLADIINSCSAWLDKWSNRASGGFSVQFYDELYNGTGDNLLFLNNVPIVSITKIATTQLPAIYIRNNDADMGSRATAQINGTWNGNGYTSSGVTLTYVSGGTTTTNTLTWTSYTTVQALADAINGLGGYWQAGVQGGFGNWSSSDLRATQGSFGCRITTAYLWIHWYELPWYRVNELTGEVWSPMGFARGVYGWRVIYSAGYASFPDDLAQALAELVAATYYAREANANMQTENLDGYSYSQMVDKAFKGLSTVAQKTFYAYKRRPVPHFSTW